jgi:putative YhdH/YhfP family quinone oxidoreductase
VISGATGGVGSLALMILSKLGYNTTASTRKKEKESYLKQLGAREIISSDDLDDSSGKPLLNRRWKGAVDTVGGNVLSTILRSLDYRCSAASCGNTLSNNIDVTVFPFILRGVNLLGINSAETPMDLRKIIWNKLSGEWKINALENIITECSLEELNQKIDLILKGEISGRVLVNLNY